MEISLFYVVGHLILGISVIYLLTSLGRIPSYSLADWLVDYASYEAANSNFNHIVIMLMAISFSMVSLMLWPASILLMSISKKEFCPIS
ncbi:MAG: hypothetical protein HQL50_05875 [Magnetococcales bacterium]|nr:hypothetical protein [Magnetococcales bacterium]